MSLCPLWPIFLCAFCTTLRSTRYVARVPFCGYISLRPPRWKVRPKGHRNFTLSTLNFKFSSCLRGGKNCSNFRIFSNIFKRFTLLFERFTLLFEYFQSFSNVFERFFLAYFTQTPQLDKPAPVFTPKTNIAPKNNLKKPYFP